MPLSITAQLALSLVLGAIIGLERESYEDTLAKKGDVRPGGLGVRTFALITLLGTVSGILRTDYFSIFLTINITYMALLLAYYIIGSFFTKDNGITTELAMAFAYILGLSVSLAFFPIQIVLAITIILILILSYKQELKQFIAGIHRREFNAFASYALISLVILPFLPKVSYSLSDLPALLNIINIYGLNLDSISHIELINPFNIWLVVALITGVDLFGYALERTIGAKKGWILASLTGGFISSTATTQSLAQQSNKNNNTNLLVAAAIFANLASFFQLFILIAIFNGALLIRSSGLILALIISSTICGVFFLKLKTVQLYNEADNTAESTKLDSILSLGPAIKFAALFLIIKAVSKIMLALFGSGGFLIASAFAAIAGIDAVVINLSELTGVSITFSTAILTIIVVNAVNLGGKVFYSFLQGKKEFAVKFGVSMLIVVLSSLVGLL